MKNNMHSYLGTRATISP
jgi:serine/threonine protein kinase